MTVAAQRGDCKHFVLFVEEERERDTRKGLSVSRRQCGSHESMAAPGVAVTSIVS